MAAILELRPRRTAVHPPCNMPLSERYRIRGNCLHGIAPLSLAQAPVADRAPAAGGAPGARRTAPASGGSSGRASRRTVLEPSGDRWRVSQAIETISEALRTVARAWARGRRSTWKTIGAGPAARLLRPPVVCVTSAATSGVLAVNTIRLTRRKRASDLVFICCR